MAEQTGRHTPRFRKLLRLLSQLEHNRQKGRGSRGFQKQGITFGKRRRSVFLAGNAENRVLVSEKRRGGTAGFLERCFCSEAVRR